MDGWVCTRWIGKREKGRSLGWERLFVRETPHVHLRGIACSILTGMHEMAYAGKNGWLCRVQGIKGAERDSMLLAVTLLLC